MDTKLRAQRYHIDALIAKNLEAKPAKSESTSDLHCRKRRIVMYAAVIFLLLISCSCLARFSIHKAQYHKLRESKRWGVPPMIVLEHHDCKIHVKHFNNSPFVSTCGSNMSKVNETIKVEVGEVLKLFACVPTSISQRDHTGSNRNHSHDSIIARFQIQRNGNPSQEATNMRSWDSTFPVNFDDLKSQHVVVGNYSCHSSKTHFLNAGLFTFDAYLEYVGHDWNPLNKSFLSPPMMTKFHSPWTVLVKDIDNRRQPVNFTLPLCTNGNAKGRWLEGRWTPHHCRLRDDLIGEFEQCAAKYDNMITWSGDSNSRRTLKSLAKNAMGRRWCPVQERTARTCMCEDNDGWDFMHVPAIKYTVVHGLFEFDLALDYVKSIDIKTRVLVVGNLVNWDAAFTTFEAFVRNLDIFVDSLHQKISMFASPPLLILRTGMFYCCHEEPIPQNDDALVRLYTRKRLMLFNEHTIKVFKTVFPYVKVWDAYAMGEARPIASSKAQIDTCQANHFSSEVVEEDLKIFLNILCNNDPASKSSGDIDELVSMHQQGLLTDEELAATKALLAEQSRRIAAQ